MRGKGSCILVRMVVKQKRWVGGSGLFGPESMHEEVWGFFIYKRSKRKSSIDQIPWLSWALLQPLQVQSPLLYAWTALLRMLWWKMSEIVTSTRLRVVWYHWPITITEDEEGKADLELQGIATCSVKDQVHLWFVCTRLNSPRKWHPPCVKVTRKHRCVGASQRCASLIFFANPARWVCHLQPFHPDTTRWRNWYSVGLWRGGHWTKSCFGVEFTWDASDGWTVGLCAVHLWFMSSAPLSSFT